MVGNEEEFIERVAGYLADGETRKKLDGNALGVVERNTGATERAYNLFKESMK